jgi:hypothetical protein
MSNRLDANIDYSPNLISSPNANLSVVSAILINRSITHPSSEEVEHPRGLYGTKRQTREVKTILQVTKIAMQKDEP